MEIVLRAEKIEKIYGKDSLSVRALQDVDLEIEKGVFYAIIGKSGSGKSTLLHILGGLDKPTGGSLYLEGRKVSELNDNEMALVRRRRIGFVFQSFNLLEEHTVLENILLPIDLDGKKPDRDYVNQVIDSLELRDRLAHYPDELSGGQRQRVAIARALAPKPAIILADEPTGNLDAKTSNEVLELLKKSAREFNQTIVLVTHDMEIAHQADRIITISDGKIVSVSSQR
ncbi:MAG: ABC transporter ATP-binding protein [Roseburia sp.]|nr:ABC transporter ATP-binding protein [Roseburia sp.]